MIKYIFKSARAFGARCHTSVTRYRKIGRGKKRNAPLDKPSEHARRMVNRINGFSRI